MFFTNHVILPLVGRSLVLFLLVIAISQVSQASDCLPSNSTLTVTFTMEDQILTVTSNNPEDELEYIEIYDNNAKLVLVEGPCAPTVCTVDFSDLAAGNYRAVAHSTLGKWEIQISYEP
jgi:hypothetical protein